MGTATSYTYVPTVNPPPGLTVLYRFETVSIRDGYESWQSPSIDTAINLYGHFVQSSGISTAVAIGASNSGVGASIGQSTVGALAIIEAAPGHSTSSSTASGIGNSQADSTGSSGGRGVVSAQGAYS